MIFEKQIIKAYRKMAFTRCDDNGTAYYFSHEDFKGLHRIQYPFSARAGHKLMGNIYHYDAPKQDRLIVFDHGFGGGHRSYMKEIERLCRRGFTVFAYDHTGCMESGGDTAGGMAQSLSDLNDCINAIKADARFSGLDISVIGHSWGGFAALNITALHPDISRIVVLSGFLSVNRLINSYFGGIMKCYRGSIMALERKSNPDFVDYDAVKTLSNTNVSALLIYSDNDHMCKRDASYDVLHSLLDGKDNIRFLLVKNKGHNPNYTVDAVNYLGEYVKAKGKLLKSKKRNTPEGRAAFVKSYDFNRMTSQDDFVWSEIFEHLEA